jgi:hypothetical protein
MIKLKKLLRESSHIHEVFLWMDSHGKTTRVPLEGHSSFAAAYLAKVYPDDWHQKDAYGKMYDLGWLRVTIMGYMGVNAVHFNLRKGKRPLQAQLDSMIELAKQYHATEIIDDTNGGVYLDVM